MEYSDDYKQGYIAGVSAVFKVILDEMDDELKKMVFKNLKIKEDE